MAKHKTLEQKVKAEKRRQQSLENFSSIPNNKESVSYSFSTTATQSVVKPSGYSAEVPNLMHDLQKTLFLSSIIVVFQIIFYFLLQKHTISLPWNLY